MAEKINNIKKQIAFWTEEEERCKDQHLTEDYMVACATTNRLNAQLHDLLA